MCLSRAPGWPRPAKKSYTEDAGAPRLNIAIAQQNFAAAKDLTRLHPKNLALAFATRHPDLGAGPTTGDEVAKHPKSLLVRRHLFFSACQY